jgi:hypothetical protein
MCGLLIFSAFAWADERTDRVEIQGIIDALNNYVPDGGQQQVSVVFMNDAHQLAHLSGLDRRLVPANRPWSETRPKIALQSIRFITPMLHWSTLQIASTALRSWFAKYRCWWL